MRRRDSAMHLECWPAITALSTFFYTDGAATPTSHVLCAIHANRRKHTHRKRRDEDEAAFENQRRACRDVLRAGFFLDGHACGGGSGRLLPHRYFRNARLRLFQPGAMPGDGFRPRLELLRESIPGGRQRQSEQQQGEQQRLCLSAEVPDFERRKEAGRAPIERRLPGVSTEGDGVAGIASATPFS